ncbi:hypothetical protein ACKLNO_06465 [Neisseriaceae bacterium B1]
MDWWHILYVCFVWIVGLVVIGVGLDVVIMLPFMLIGFLVGCVYSVFRIFLPFLPSFWNNASDSDNSSSNSTSNDNYWCNEKKLKQKNTAIWSNIFAGNKSMKSAIGVECWLQ